MKSYMKKIAAVVAVAGVALSTAACSNSGTKATVASYKGGKITQEQYYDEMKKSQAGKSTLANMIINRALNNQENVMCVTLRALKSEISKKEAACHEE